MSGRLASAVTVVGAWTALAVFFAVSSSLTYISQGRPPIWGLALAYALAQWWLWAALTPLVFVAARRWPLARRRLALHLGTHVVLSLAVAYFKVTAEGYVRLWLFEAEPYLIISNLALQVLIYWVLVAVVHGLDQYGRSRARAADAEARLNEAQLELLRRQLQPHFLFNALNAISELVHEDPQRADQMIGRLSDLLRASLDAGERAEVSFAEELALAQSYVAIQQVRFGDRLRVSIDVAPECGRIAVPHLFLQPLIENAIRHGLAPSATGGLLSLTAGLEGHSMVIRVADDGVGWAHDATEGVGLTNTRSRLGSLYADRASLDVDSRPGGGAEVRIVLPVRRIGRPLP